MADIRFNRLAVTIFDNPSLNWYFRNGTVMDRACLYYGIDDVCGKIGTHDIRSTIKFLETLYDQDFSVFVQLLNYIVKQMPEYYHNVNRYARIWPVEINRGHVMDSLPQFFRELRTLGIYWDGQKLIPTVGSSQIDHRISSRIA